MNTFKLLESFLKRNVGENLPEIRYFDGIDAFCDKNGKYKNESLEESIKIFLRENTKSI